MKKYLAIGLCSLALFGCKANKNLELVVKEQSVKITQPYKKVSYKLEELCDTELYEKNIMLHVYIEPSEILWDYHKYKEEIFSYVKQFFKEQKINCKIVYSNSSLEPFKSNNEFGLEILDSKDKMEDRFYQLVTEQCEVPKNNPLSFDEGGYAVGRAGIGLVSVWEEFRSLIKKGEMTIEEVEKQFPEKYKGMTVRENLFKQNAALICHEVLHCMGLWHPQIFTSQIIEMPEDRNSVPNLMDTLKLPKFKENNVLGFKIDRIQQKIIHSFVSGNNSYKAFVQSYRDLDLYWENLAEANNLKLNK